jgi:hypothetical protein
LLLLTYARRYALFTLVGIAGEDDLDAPDLHDADVGSPGPTDGTGNVDIGQQGAAPRPRSSANGHARGAAKVNAAVLAPDQSAVLRDRLLGEVTSITEVDKAAIWARGVLAAKNSLTAADAKVVEDAFEQRSAGLLEAVGTEAPEAPQEPLISVIAPAHPAAKALTAKAKLAADDQPGGIDKSVLAIAEPRRYRNKEHLRFVATKPCLVCGRKPSDPHHLRFTQPRALGRKVSDEFAVPLCRIHHRLVHRVGNESAWWKEAGIDPVKAAGKLWKRTRLDDDRSESKDTKEAAAADRTSEPRQAGKPPTCIATSNAFIRRR